MKKKKSLAGKKDLYVVSLFLFDRHIGSEREIIICLKILFLSLCVCVFPPSGVLSLKVYSALFSSSVSPLRDQNLFHTSWLDCSFPSWEFSLSSRQSRLSSWNTRGWCSARCWTSSEGETNLLVQYRNYFHLSEFSKVLTLYLICSASTYFAYVWIWGAKKNNNKIQK